MNGARHWACIVMLSLVASTSCRLFRRSKPAPPPPPLVVVSPPPAKPAEPTVPPPQEEIPVRQEELPPEIQPLPPSIEVPPPKSPRVTRRRPPQAPAPSEPEDTAPSPSPLPQLQQILTPEQRQALNRSVDLSMVRAHQSLNALAGRRLTDEQNTIIERVQTFLRQAEEARANDLVRAKNLAERAEVLATDLLNSLR